MSAYRSFSAKLLGAAVLTLLAIPAGMAQTPAATPPTSAPPPPIVMVIDADRIMSEAKAVKSIEAQLQPLRDALQKDAAKREDELRAAAQDLQKQQASGPSDSFDAKRRALEKRANDYQQEFAGRRRALEQGTGEAADKVKRALRDVVQQIAEERHANLVLLASQLILFEPAYDASADALKRLDQKLSSVKVVIGKPTDAPSASNAANAGFGPAPGAGPRN